MAESAQERMQRLYQDGLDYERALLEIEHRIRELEKLAETSKVDVSAEIESLRREHKRQTHTIFENLTPWQRIQLARHPRRPRTRSYIDALTNGFIELHGDRAVGDDGAIIAGFAELDGSPVAVIGHQKGTDTDENMRFNFGMASPEGFRKALRIMRLAEKFRRPILIFIDTPGAYPGLEAERHGQAEAIARNIAEMSRISVPAVSVVIGEGGSGGALAISVSDRVLMLEYSTYQVCSPEACAAILWKDGSKADEAAKALGGTAYQLVELGIVDKVIKEPLGGAHQDPVATARSVKEEVITALQELAVLSESALLEQRYQKLRKIGAFEEAPVPVLE
jgi:acetyl-CoA carboxylase carboxyl transferase subunit alpha